MYNFTADRLDLDHGQGVTAVVHDDGADVTIAFGDGETVHIPGLTLGVAGGLSGVVAITDCLRCTFRRARR